MLFSDLAKKTLNKSCELFSVERQVIFSISALCSVSHDFNTRRGEKKKAFLNLWNMASSVLTVNWVFLGEWSESGSAEATATNDNTRLGQPLHPPKTSAVVQVFPIFLLFLPASFPMVCWDKHSCWQISLYPHITPEVLGERMPTNAMHKCCQILLKTACSAGTAFSWIFMPPCSELRSDKSYDTSKYSIRVAINIP